MDFKQCLQISAMFEAMLFFVFFVFLIKSIHAHGAYSVYLKCIFSAPNLPLHMQRNIIMLRCESYEIY